jgi:hypothetical protein
MASDITNIDIGSARVTLGGVDLGHVLGGSEVTITRETTEMFVDQFAGPVNLANTYESVEVVLNLGEADLVKLKESFPLTKSTATSTAIQIGSEAGITYRQFAAQMVIHPYNRSNSDLEADLVIENAVAHGDISYAYSKEDQKVFSVTFTGLIAPNGRLAYLGASPV